MKTNNTTVALSSCDTDISSDPSSAASSNEMHLFCLFLQKDPSEQPEHQYDEFGFRVDTEGNTQFFCPLFPTLVEFLNLSQETWMHIFISGRGGYILYTDWLRERERKRESLSYDLLSYYFSFLLMVANMFCTTWNINYFFKACSSSLCWNYPIFCISVFFAFSWLLADFNVCCYFCSY